MKLTKQIKAALAEAYQCAMEISILDMKAPLRYINQYIAENVSGFGTAADEKVKSREDYRKMLMKSRQQAKGMLFNAKIITPYRPKFIDETTAQFHDEIVVQIGDKKNKHSIHLYMSCVYKYRFNKWQLVLFHGSMPDAASTTNDTFHLGEAEKKMKQLELVVAQRTADLQTKTRELEIEASLERVRAVTMGMNKPGDVLNICKVFFSELQSLGFKDLRNTLINFWDDENSLLHDYDYSDFAGGNFARLPYSSHPTFSAFQKKIRKAKDAFAKLVIDKDGLKSWQQRRRSSGEYNDPRLNKISALYYYFYSTGVGALGISTFSPISKDEVEVLKKFRNVFDMAYQRYVDIEKAEAQAREVQIELALERVRARTMAMKHSDELAEASFLLDSQVRALGINTRGCAFNIYGDNESTEWFSSEAGTMPTYKTPREKIFLRYYEAGLAGKAIHIETIEGKACAAHYQYLCTLPIMGDALKEMKANGGSFPVRQTDHVIYFKYGYLLFITLDPVPESHDIFIRFAKVFEQTYTRFLDLQKAEAQARESQIQLALERVRARTMAMQNSNELPEAANLLFQQVQLLGMPAWSAGYCTWNDDKKSAITLWMSSEGVMQPAFSAPTTKDELFIEMRKGSEQEKSLHVVEMGGKKLVKHYQYMRTLPLMGEILDSIISTGHSLPTFQIMHQAYFSKGFLLFITYQPVPDAHDIFKRFGKVFDQTYTRFLDLQKAEAQAKEAQIEAAMEKVRSRSLAMQKPEELIEVAELLRKEMGQLGVEELETSSIYIVDKENKQAECWYAIKDIREENKRLASDEMTIALDDTWVSNEMRKFYLSQKEQASIVMTGDNRKEWINYCAKKSNVLQGYYGDEIPERTYHLVKFNGGYMGAASPGDISTESWDLLRRAASVFSLAYTRFNDLQIAEAHAMQAEQDLIAIKEAKQKAEAALSELQATQKQLIQSEKMASLGELTAGIAHEIQNPLNFVNNFSEVSKELLDEMKEAIEKGDTEEAKEIMNDVIQNLEKINHHGKRADGIVKGMLQHSRSSSGQKELTDINALADEYLRLAYHGLRAKDKSFNATMKTDYDETIGNINIIPQDIGRVVLNLITNAFYVVNEKKTLLQTQGDSYEPTVSVSTKKIGDKVLISVKDNGNGIPQKVLDKIFQPFFTTKPTGQGTGLGLSLSYDIVKVHGGELNVKTKENEFTEFVITLPFLRSNN